MHKFLIHKRGDHVGVATGNIEPNETLTGVYMDDNSSIEVVARGAIPLGHKISLVDLMEDSDVIEYGQVIGLATTAWVRGDYVHTHNLKSKRW